MAQRQVNTNIIYMRKYYFFKIRDVTKMSLLYLSQLLFWKREKVCVKTILLARV